MAYCPNCLIEYAEGSLECVDCHVPLNAGARPAPEPAVKELELTPNTELVRIRTFSGPTGAIDAELARNILQTQDIACVLPGEGHAEMLPGIDVIQLLVRKEDAEKAAEVLESYLDNPAGAPAEDGPAPAE
jgi:hypothetical protein